MSTGNAVTAANSRVHAATTAALRAIELIGTAAALIAMVVLALRAAVHFDSSWDTIAYHLPFAALRADVGISFEMNERLVGRYEGFPPLPEFAQGMLWRLTGSPSSIGLVSFAAFSAFVLWCQRLLRAPFWVVVLVSLTAPMVLIHATAGYVDLLANSFLAIGAATVIHMWLFPEQVSRAHLIGGTLALAAACWSKYTVAPFAVLLLTLYLPLAMRAAPALRWRATMALLIPVLALALAVLPYVWNTIEYGNPFWPYEAPLVGSLFPYLESSGANPITRPAHLLEASSVEAFLRSILEIDLPTDYPDRTRWSIDSGGDVGDAFRMGGFWYVGVVFFLGSSLVLLARLGRRGIVVDMLALVVLVIVASLPTANELRYWLFIPLTWAAVVGMLFRDIVRGSPRMALVMAASIVALFGYMVAENLEHFQPTDRGWEEAAQLMGIADYWPLMDPGETYCAVGMSQRALFLTGPRLIQYRVVDRSSAELCPEGSIVVTDEGFAE